MRRSGTIPATLAALLCFAITGAAFAANPAREKEDNDQKAISAIQQAKTSLVQAITAAEQETGGKAIETGIENRDGILAYEITTAKGNTLETVLVDPDSGKVVTVKHAGANSGERDHTEHGEHEDE